MRVITESEGVRVWACQDGDYVIAPAVGPRIRIWRNAPTEVLLAIVADRLNRKGQTHPALRMSIDELCAAALSPDTKQEEGR